MIALVAAAAMGCSRAPLPRACPSLSPGDLVVSEIREGNQSGGDVFGQWIEIYNRRDDEIALGGVRIELRKLDGTGTSGFVVRDAALRLGPHQYAVLGRFAADGLPGFVDYGYRDEFEGTLPNPGLAFLRSCDDLIDLASYTLPSRGTTGQSGDADPAPNGDRDAGMPRWCTDDHAASDGGTAGDAPGTPGQRNQTCP